MLQRIGIVFIAIGMADGALGQTDAGIYTGTIADKYAIQLQVDTDIYSRNGTRYYGKYFYESVGTPISLSGGYQGSTLILDESTGEKKTGTFIGKFAENGFNGTWINANTGKSLPFSLTRVAAFTTMQRDTTGWTIRYRYPVFDGRDPFIDLVNSTIFWNCDAAFEKHVAFFRENYEFDENFPPFEAYRSYSLSVAYEGLISLLVELYESTGGAHGNQYFDVVNVGFVSGQPTLLELGHLFKPASNYKSVLSDAGIRHLTVAEAPYVVDGSITELDDAMLRIFTLSPAGFHLHFAPYTVGPYAGGSTTITIPWKELTSIADPEGPLWPFLKK